MGTRVTRTFDMCPCKRATGPGRPPSKVDIYPVSRGRFHRQKTSRDPWCRFSFPSRSLFFFFSFFFCSIVILPPFVSRSACTCLPGRLLACLLARAIRVRSCFSFFFSLSLSLSLSNPRVGLVRCFAQFRRFVGHEGRHEARYKL